MVMKKSVSILFIGLLLFSVIAGLGFVAADSSFGAEGSVSKFFKEGPLGFLRGDAKFDAGVGILGWSFFILILIFIYSALDFFSVPKSALLKGVVAVVVSFIAVSLVSESELYTALQSYGALGITFVIIIPIIILSFFSLMVAVKANPMGILAQRLIWIVYSVYLLFRSSILLINQYLLVGKVAGEASGFEGAILNLFVLFAVDTTELSKASADPLILLINVIVAVSVFVIFVFMNDRFTKWIMDKARDYEILRAKDKAEKAKASADIEASKIGS